MCAVWDLNGNGGSAGPRGGEIQGSQRASIHAASGNVVARERLFLFVVGGGS